MDVSRLIINKQRFLLTVDRLCYELIENHGNFEDTCLIGIQDRGAILSDFLMGRLKNSIKDGAPVWKTGHYFYRDDYRHREKPLKASSTLIDFIVEDKKVVLVDDVLYSAGRCTQPCRPSRTLGVHLR